MVDEPKALKDQRIHVLMTEGEVQSVDDWAFANRIRSRGEAMRRLCQIAITTDKRLPVLLQRVMASVAAYQVARSAARNAMEEAKLPPAFEVAWLDQYTKSLDLAQNAMFALAELMVTTSPLRRSSDDIGESLTLRDDLVELISGMNPVNDDDTKAMAEILRALAATAAGKHPETE